jgi:hypothetical protein
MARTVIQITADPSYLYALCDDGEIFRLVNHLWQPMAPIPQDDPRPGTGRNPDLILSRMNSQAARRQRAGGALLVPRRCSLRHSAAPSRVSKAGAVSKDNIFCRGRFGAVGHDKESEKSPV